MNEEQLLLNSISPGMDHRFVTMLVYADWLEEHGRLGEAEGWRWISKNRKWPFKSGSGWYFWMDDGHRVDKDFYSVGDKIGVLMNETMKDPPFGATNIHSLGGMAYFRDELTALKVLAKVAGEK